jgi:2-C-methyl-D-erythritol 2,4-cyclodiphosphate synthase
LRIGIGYDVHAFAPGRRLVLGGVEIPYPRGLAGHSDADVLTHALMDAILGAMRTGDIGQHFPDSDERWRDADSLDLLRRVGEMMRGSGWFLVDADCVLILEQPKVAPYREQIRQAMAQALGVEAERIGVKATTTEGLGYAGRGEGVAAQAVAMLEWVSA